MPLCTYSTVDCSCQRRIRCHNLESTRQLHAQEQYRHIYFTMSRPSYHQRSASVGKVDYSNLFHSGLQAISDSTQGHRRSMSTPPSLEALPSPTPSSIRSSIRSNFWSLGSQSSDRDDTSSQWAERSAPNSSASVITGESTPEFRDVWMIKGVPLQLGLSRTL